MCSSAGAPGLGTCQAAWFCTREGLQRGSGRPQGPRISPSTCPGCSCPKGGCAHGHGSVRGHLEHRQQRPGRSGPASGRASPSRAPSSDLGPAAGGSEPPVWGAAPSTRRHSVTAAQSAGRGRGSPRAPAPRAVSPLTRGGSRFTAGKRSLGRDTCPSTARAPRDTEISGQLRLPVRSRPYFPSPPGGAPGRF